MRQLQVTSAEEFAAALRAMSANEKENPIDVMARRIARNTCPNCLVTVSNDPHASALLGEEVLHAILEALRLGDYGVLCSNHSHVEI